MLRVGCCRPPLAALLFTSQRDMLCFALLQVDVGSSWNGCRLRRSASTSAMGGLDS